MSTATVKRVINFPGRQRQGVAQSGGRLVSMRTRRELQRPGTIDKGEAVSRDSRREENALAFRETAELKDKLTQEKLYLEEEIRSEMNFDQIVGTARR